MDTNIKLSLLLLFGALSYFIAPLWMAVDRLIFTGVTSVSRTVRRDRWDNSFSSRKRVLWMYFFGLCILVAFPFAPFIGMDPGTHFVERWFRGGNDNSEGSFPVYELWEVATVGWTLLFLIVILIAEFATHFDKLGMLPRNVFLTGAAMIIIVGGSSVLIAYLLLFDHPAHHRVFAELIIGILLCASDAYLICMYRRRHMDSEASDFGVILACIDIPALFSFFLLWIFLLLASSSPDYMKWSGAFAAGAAALNLLVINTLFSVIYCWEKYKDAPIVVPPTEDLAVG